MTTELQGSGDGTNQPVDGNQSGGKPAEADPNAKLAEGKPADGGKPAESDPNAGKPAAGKDEAPADYKFEAPEGVELDQDLLGEFTTIAKDLKLPAEAAQKLVNLGAKLQVKQAEAHVAQVAKWAEDAKADKELGGDKLPETLATARKAIDLGPPELKGFLNDTGLGNHPLVLKWAHAVGKALSEESTVAKGDAGGGSKSAASVLYGNPPKK